MIPYRLHVTGSGNEARFAESFDLDKVVKACTDPTVAELVLDEHALLGCLTAFAGSGPWDPHGRSGRDPTGELLGGLEPHPTEPSVRLWRFVIHYPPGDTVDVVTFAGVALTADQTVVSAAGVETINLNT